LKNLLKFVKTVGIIVNDCNLQCIDLKIAILIAFWRVGK
jgi:hypothetical protein